MNSVQLVGRFTRDPDIRYSESGTSIARFTLAVDRVYKREEGPGADFISCIAFGKAAEFIERYFYKGKQIGAIGRIQTGSYTNRDGVKIYTTDVVVERVEFVGNKTDTVGEEVQAGIPTTADDGFMNIPDGIDEELPF